MIIVNATVPPAPIDVSAEFDRSCLPWTYRILDEFVGDHTPDEREAFLDMAWKLPRIKFVGWPYPRHEVVRGG